jgi:hypothetical protein
MTDSTPVRRFILDGYGGVPRTEVVLASDFDRLQAESVRLKVEVAAEKERAALAKVEWQPIETAPAEGESLFYVVPREPHEQPLFERRDKGVVQTWKPYVFQGRYRTWSCLAKATHWMPLPDPPAMTAKWCLTAVN